MTRPWRVARRWRAPGLRLVLAWLTPAVLPGTAAAAATVGPAVRIFSDYAATDPGTDALAAVLARGGGLRSFGLPAAGPGVVDTEDQDWTVWGTGFGDGNGVRAREPGAGELRSTRAGFVVGADRRIGENAVLGFAVGNDRTTFRETDAAPRGTADATTLAAYGAWSWPDVLYAAAAVQYGVAHASAGSSASTDRFSPNTVRAGALVGHLIDLSGFTFSPVAELEYADTDGGTLRASGAGALVIEVPGQHTLTGRAGVRVNSAFYRWGVLGSPFVSLLWERRLQTADGGGPARPPPLEPDDGTVAAGVAARIPGGMTLGFELADRFGGRVDERLARFSVTAGF